MAREDIRINLSFKNTVSDRMLYEFVISESEVIGISSYLKQLIQKAMIESQNKK